MRVPDRDIEWELRVPPFRLGWESELIRQINERWTYDLFLCYLFIPWIPTQSDSSQPVTAASFSLHLTHTGTVDTGLLWWHWNNCFYFTPKVFLFHSYLVLGKAQRKRYEYGFYFSLCTTTLIITTISSHQHCWGFLLSLWNPETTVSKKLTLIAWVFFVEKI